MLISWICSIGHGREWWGMQQTSKPGSPLYPLLNEINAAVTHGAPFLAIAMTVALPDICVSLISPDGRSDGDRYKAWCKDNLGSKFDVLTGADLWSMRCGVLHNGRFGDLKHNVGRVIFALPDQGSSYVNCQLNDAYFYSAVDFCRNFTAAVHIWFEKNKDNETVKSNLPRLMQYRVGGMKGYVEGETTVLA
jgi:hypothetical protein